jgi:hypothetical protein
LDASDELSLLSCGGSISACEPESNSWVIVLRFTGFKYVVGNCRGIVFFDLLFY